MQDGNEAEQCPGSAFAYLCLRRNAESFRTAVRCVRLMLNNGEWKM